MKNYKIKIINKLLNINYTLICNEDEYILDLIEKSNYYIPYSCRSGNCSTCIAKILNKKGTVFQLKPNYLTKIQLLNNYILTCITIPTSNLTLLIK
uniref:Ferredoxin n=1 Tax=Spumella sp. NIES-1846 TaxID=2490549 RepID=A0A455RFR3_9STRA|nr:ferredoxin [Spumella sp. NIES-1846]